MTHLMLLALLPTVASDLPAAKSWTNSIGIALVRIEPGDFSMGQAGPPADYRMNRHPERFDDADWDERPVHRVSITRPFGLGRTEVTNAQYEQFRPEHRQRRGIATGDDEAVVNVNWDDAVAFCRWLSEKEGRPYRLPTEAEWEYACRAGTATLFHTGDQLPPGFHKWVQNQGRKSLYFGQQPLPPEYRQSAGKEPLRVGQTPANAWGLCDMHGNVEEWCADWYGPYEAASQRDPVGRADGDFRITRGGSHSVFTRLLRSANRSGRVPQSANSSIGFRVAAGEAPASQPLPPPAPPLNAQHVSQTPLPATIERRGGVPSFVGPWEYVKIPPQSFGPLFSTHNHSPAIAECANGDLLAIWYSCVDEAGSELCVIASRLPRGERAWQPASPFWDGPDVNDHAPKLWFDGRQTLYHFVTSLSENLVRTSTDNGATWSKARPLQPTGEFANRPIRTREGFLVVPHDNRSTSLVISRDEGQTWTYPLVASKYLGYRPGVVGPRLAGIHNALAQLSDGRLLALGRFDDVETQERFGFKTPMSISADWGVSWSYTASPFPAISSCQRPAMLRLEEGPLVFFSFTDQWRDWRKNRKGMPFDDCHGGTFTGYGLYAAVSYDDGQTWPLRKLITPGGREQKPPTTDGGPFTLNATQAEPVGYLAACQGRDGTIHLITSRNHYALTLAWLKQPPQ